MRRPRDICSLCRPVFKVHHSTPSYTRYASAKSREPYILPRLVIDLDANDNQFVREAKEEDFAVPDKPPRRQRYVPIVPGGSAEKGFRLNYKASPAFDLRAATSPDLLQYALLGRPSAIPKDDNVHLRETLDHLKIHDLDSVDSKIKRLTYNFMTDSSKLLERAGLTADAQQFLSGRIRQCRSFDDLKRVVSNVASTTEGCEFLAARGADVVNGIWRCRKLFMLEDRNNTSKATTINVLKLLNNLRLNMDSKGIALGPDLCNAALYYAAKAFCLPSVRIYLTILDGNSYRPRKRAVRAISEMAINSRQGSFLQSSRKPRMDEEDRNREALQLITGWESNSNPQASGKRQLSFASAVVARASPTLRKHAYSTYIDALGHVGAVNALWREWQSGQLVCLGSKAPSGIVEASDLRAHGENFALAFFMAKDPKLASHVLKTYFELAGDLETPENALSPQSRSKILSFYKRNNIQPTDRFQEQLSAEFPFEGRQAIFQKLNDLIVPEWIVSRDFADVSAEDKSVHYLIDWVEREGVKGVAIIDRYQNIMHFKPSSRYPSSLDTVVSSNHSQSSAIE